MQNVTVNFGLPEHVAAKLVTGEYTRVGGVIRDAQGRVTCWLRETSPFPLSPYEISTHLPSNVPQILDLAGSVSSVLNLGIPGTPHLISREFQQFRGHPA